MPVCIVFQDLTDRTGIIQTPNFPGRFPVPYICAWTINTTGIEDPSVVVYFTQYYLTSGVTFSQMPLLDHRLVHNVTVYTPNKNSKWIQSTEKYFMISVNVTELEGNHLRFLDDRKNVYYVFGFNITYEILSGDEKPKNGCNPQFCSLLGDCIASADYRTYKCVCFNGYSGPTCSEGPLCKDNPCKNGGTCR